MKQILFEMGQNQDEKKKLLNGRQVDLAEELSKHVCVFFALATFRHSAKFLLQSGVCRGFAKFRLKMFTNCYQ